MPRLIAFFMMAAAFLVGGCRTQDVKQEPLRLTLAVNDIYCTDTACACVHHIAARTYGETLDRLRADYGIDLQFEYFVEPYELEDAVKSGTYDGVLCKPWIVFKDMGESGEDYTRVVDVVDPNDNRWLSGILVVMADSNYKTPADLQGARVVIGDADAYEKHHAAKRLFKAQGLTFSEVQETASCIENLGILMDQKVDVAIISDYALMADCAVDFASPDDFRILAETEKIPLTSMMLNMKRVSEADQARIQKALLEISGSEAPASLLSKGFVEPAEWNPPELKE